MQRLSVLVYDLLIVSALILMIFISSCKSNQKSQIETKVKKYLNTNKHQINNNWLKQLETITADMNDTTRVNYLRTWVYQHTDTALPKSTIQDFKYWTNLPLNEKYYCFEKDLAGILCGGVANFLAQLYTHFGYPSYTYSIGDNATGASHMVTLVNIGYGYVVQDAYFNITYTDKNGASITLLKMLKMLKKGNNQQITVTTTINDTMRTDFLVGKKGALWSRIYRPFAWTVSKNVPYKHQKRNSKFQNNKIVSVRTIEQYEEQFHKRYYNFLEQKGHPKDMNYLFLEPINIRPYNTWQDQRFWTEINEITGATSTSIAK